MNPTSVIPFPQLANAVPAHIERITPQNLDAEQSTLGACLIERDAISKTLEYLTAEDFYRELHKKIFTAITKLFEAGEPVDLISMVGALRGFNALEEIGGAAYLTVLIESCPTAGSVENYAREVQDNSIRRKLLKKSDEIKSWAYDPTIPVADLVESAEQGILSVGSMRSSNRAVSLAEATMQIGRTLCFQIQNKGHMTGAPTGFPDLDARFLGLQKQEMYVIAGRPGMGKSAIAMQIAQAVASQGKPVVFASLEMSTERLTQRAICSRAGVNASNLGRGYASPQELEDVSYAMRALSSLPLFVDESPSMTLTTLRAICRRVVAEKGPLGMLGVDYLQLVNPVRPTGNRVTDVSEIARGMKQISREFDCPVIALAQLSRKCEEREDKRPMLSDLRESGAIEAEADAVIFLYRDAYYRNEDAKRRASGDAYTSEADNVAEVIVAKNRNGSPGTIKLGWQGEYTRFVSLMPDQYDGDYATANNRNVG